MRIGHLFLISLVTACSSSTAPNERRFRCGAWKQVPLPVLTDTLADSLKGRWVMDVRVCR